MLLKWTLGCIDAKLKRYTVHLLWSHIFSQKNKEIVKIYVGSGVQNDISKYSKRGHHNKVDRNTNNRREYINLFRIYSQTIILFLLHAACLYRQCLQFTENALFKSWCIFKVALILETKVKSESWMNYKKNLSSATQQILASFKFSKEKKSVLPLYL